MNLLRRILAAGLISGFGLIAGCSEQEPTAEREPQLTPADALEKYLLEESRLRENRWQYYTAVQKPSGWIAYVIYPDNARFAPVETELMRLCPDSRFHDFWSRVSLPSFEMILMKDVDRTAGKARKLAQVTCRRDFDLVAFEESTLEQPETQEATPEPASDSSAPLPDATIQSYAIDTTIMEAQPLEATTYEFPPEELARVKALVKRFESKSIDTTGMDAYYPDFPYFFERVPFFERATSTAPTDEDRYSEYLYQDGLVRVQNDIRNGEKQVQREIFHDDRDAPVVAFEGPGSANSAYAYFAAVLEYDERGYLNRVTHFASSPFRVIAVAIYDVGSNYNDSRRYYFRESDNGLKLAERYRHTDEGSYTWTARTGTERKFTSTPLTRRLDYMNRYPSLAPVVPLPD